MGLRTQGAEGALNETRRAPLVLLLLIALPACRSAEHEVIDRFFEASLRGDQRTVAALSMVALPETPASWKVIRIEEEQREPYRIPALRERVEEASDRRDEQYKLFGAFRQANYDDLLRIQRELAADPERKLAGKLADLQRQWDAFREERRELVDALREAEQALEWEVRCIQKSLQREADPEHLSGETLHREARVRVGIEGGERIYLVTLTRYDVRNAFQAVVPTRWIVTGVEPEGPGPQPTTRS